MAAPTKKRVRRSPEEARRIILDAAEVELFEKGPDGIRLQAVATAAGISHPSILHHFGGREKLVEAVVARAILKLQAELVAVYQGEPEDPTATALRIMSVLTDKGYGRLYMWLVLSGRPVGFDQGSLVDTIADAMHQQRLAVCEARGEPPPTAQDSRFFVMAATMAFLGESVCGPQMRQNDPALEAPFRQWMASFFDPHSPR